MSRTKNIISVCALKDIKTWFYASRAILRSTTTNEAWLRYGQSLYKSVDEFFTLEHKKNNYAFISFEVWDTYTEDTR